MRTDLTEVGFTEYRSAQDVDQAIPHANGTLLLVFNSVCGCAAGTCRPGVKLALKKSAKTPDHLGTVFAGQDTEATATARKYTLPFPPSSPSIALFKNGQLVHFVERHMIEGRSADMIADHLSAAFEEFC